MDCVAAYDRIYEKAMALARKNYDRNSRFGVGGTTVDPDEVKFHIEMMVELATAGAATKVPDDCACDCGCECSSESAGEKQ